MADDAMLSWITCQTARAKRFSDAHPLALDLLGGALILAVSFSYLATQHRFATRSVIFGVALCLPLALRRRWPELSFAAVVLVGFLQWLLSVPQLADIAILIALYTVAERSRSVYVALAAATVEAGAIAACCTWVVIGPLKVWLGLTGLTVAAAGLGIAVRQRRQLLESMRERTARMERERDQELTLAAVGERARIAREMHDIVSHNLTVMIALADGASYAMDGSPDQVRPAIEQVSTTGRMALGEMRRLLGVLRDEPTPGPLEPQPSLDRLDDLVNRVEAAGIPVSVDIQGDPHRLSEGLQLTVFRVAQEALTNTLKHAVDPTRATIALRCGPDGVELDVGDDGRTLVRAGAGGGAGAGVGSDGGRGLPGMRERAAAYDGRLEAGPLRDGGWRVHLAIDA